MQIQQKLSRLLKDVGAIRAEVTAEGVATHWITEREADNAVGRFMEMGLLFVEKTRDNDYFAVFAKFPVVKSKPVFNTDHPAYNPGRRFGPLRR